MGIILYILTALCDVLSLWFRWWIGHDVVGSRFPNTVVADVLGYALAFGPFVWSLAAYAGIPGGDWLTRAELKARKATPHERSIVEAALDQISASKVAKPRRWYVIDNPMTHAYVVGDVLYLQRGLIEDTTLKPLAPILAHALGHLANGDGRLVLALRRLSFPGCLSLATRLFGIGETARSDRGMRYASASRTSILPLLLSTVLFLFAGGLGTGVLAYPWKRYWQRRELLADHYARALGYGSALAEALRHWFFFDIAVPFMHTQPLSLNRARLQVLRD